MLFNVSETALDTIADIKSLSKSNQICLIQNIKVVCIKDRVYWKLSGRKQ